MKRPNSSSKVAVVTSSPFSSAASTPVHLQVTKPSLSRPPTVTTTTVANTNENDTANMVAAAAAALPAAGTVLVTQSGGGGLFSFSIRKLLWSVAILFIGWWVYTKRSKIMLWLMPDKKPRVIQKRPFEKEEFASSSSTSTTNQVGSNETVAINPENKIEDMRAKRLKKMNTTEGVEPQPQCVVASGEHEEHEAEEEEKEDEHQHSEQQKMEMLHELNMMVGDIDIFPTIPMFHPPPPHDASGGGGLAFVMSTGPQPPSILQDNRITEIIDEPVQNETGSDHVHQQQQEPVIQATATTPSTGGGGGGSTGFGKRSRRKQE